MKAQLVSNYILSVNPIQEDWETLYCTQKKLSVLATMRVPDKDTSKYGIVDLAVKLEEQFYEVDQFVGKPKAEEAPSNLAIIGRYLLNPEIFEMLEKQAPGAGNKVQLTDAIENSNKTQKVLAHEFKGMRYDVGDKFGFMTTSIEYGLQQPKVKDNLKEYLIQLDKELCAEK